MTIHVKLIWPANELNAFVKGNMPQGWVDHYIPLQNVDSYGRFPDTDPDSDDTRLVMKSGIEYRIMMPASEFKEVHDHWATNTIVYLPRN